MMIDLLITRLAHEDVRHLDDSQTSDLLNAPDSSLPTVRSDVLTKDVQEILLSTGEWSRIVIAAEDLSVDVKIRSMAIALRDTIRQSNEIRMTQSSIYNAVTTTIRGLVMAQLLSNETGNSLLNLAEHSQSWAKHYHVVVTPETVFEARGRVKFVQEGK